MNSNRLIGFAAAAVILTLLVFAARYFFEIYPRTRQVPPSREAMVNEYLAFDRWLESRGQELRTEEFGDINLLARAAEKNIFIQASLFSWSREAAEYLLDWVEKGGNLFLSLDYHQIYWDSYADEYKYWDDEDALSLLEEFGITVGAETLSGKRNYDSESPDYDREIAFEIIPFEGAEVSAEILSAEVPVSGEFLAMKDRNGDTRLVRAKRGQGQLTVTGLPFFLQSRAIEETPNARLAWALFMEDAPGGWLFIRGAAKVRGLLGSLFREGNFPVLLVSILVLLITGFWAAIPLFGIGREYGEKPGKSLRERFLAEGRFLRKYGALDHYRGVYLKEIKRRLAGKEGLVSDEELRRKILETGKSFGDERDLRFLAEILRGRPVPYRDFPKMIVIFKTILERI